MEPTMSDDAVSDWLWNARRRAENSRDKRVLIWLVENMLALRVSEPRADNE